MAKPVVPRGHSRHVLHSWPVRLVFDALVGLTVVAGFFYFDVNPLQSLSRKLSVAEITDIGSSVPEEFRGAPLICRASVVSVQYVSPESGQPVSEDLIGGIWRIEIRRPQFARLSPSIGVAEDSEYLTLFSLAEPEVKSPESVVIAIADRGTTDNRLWGRLERYSKSQVASR